MSKKEEEQMDSLEYLARVLIKQIESESETCAYWMVSAISKLVQANPKREMKDLLKIFSEEIPLQKKEYAKYLRET